MPRSTVLILNPRPDSPRITSRKRATGAVKRGVAEWAVKGVSMRLLALETHARAYSHAVPHGPSLPAPVWAECWRTAQAAVLQPYQPYQAHV
jgi:hypothetical protein